MSDARFRCGSEHGPPATHPQKFVSSVQSVVKSLPAVIPLISSCIFGRGDHNILWSALTTLAMRCPKCGNLEDKVIDSRSAKAGAAIRRRRECLACQHRFTTYEEIERRDLRVIKRDGRHEPFDRQKLLGGMVKACEKRPVSYDGLERAVEEIIQELEQAYDHEVPTNAIGIRVMERLHSMDEVAYIRYASVYRQFQDIGEFINEIESLGRKIKRNALQPDLFVP
jgi:transcriptional repressor NrdR